MKRFCQIYKSLCISDFLRPHEDINFQPEVDYKRIHTTSDRHSLSVPLQTTNQKLRSLGSTAINEDCCHYGNQETALGSRHFGLLKRDLLKRTETLE